MIRLATSALALGLLSATAYAAPVTYNVDKSHSILEFSYNHLGFSVTEGRFKDFDIKLAVDKENPADSTVDVTVKMPTLDAYFDGRTEHFLTGDFFDAEKFPTATFKSTKVEKTGDDTLKVTGDLTIKGITKPAVLDVTVLKMAEHPMAKKEAIGFDINTTVKRSDYGMDMYVPYVSDEVKVHFNAEAEIADGE